MEEGIGKKISSSDDKKQGKAQRGRPRQQELLGVQDASARRMTHGDAITLSCFPQARQPTEPRSHSKGAPTTGNIHLMTKDWRNGWMLLFPLFISPLSKLDTPSTYINSSPQVQAVGEGRTWERLRRERDTAEGEEPDLRLNSGRGK